MKKILRWTNIARLAGFAMVIGGQFLPVGQLKVSDWFEVPANMVQISGFLIAFAPLAREIWSKWQDRNGAKT